MFNNLEVNGEKIPEGQKVRIVRDNSSWWVQPAGLDAYLIAAIIVVLGIAAGFLAA